VDVSPLPVGAAAGDDTRADARPGLRGADARPARRPRNVRVVVLGLVVGAALVFVLVRGLGNATLFFYNVDEAVARRAELGDDRFRLQGTVEAESVARSEDGATFTLGFGGAVAAVRHRGDLPQLFEPGIPVVLEGRFEGDRFESDRMLVKHSEVYVAENPDRVGGYGEGGGVAPPDAGAAPDGSRP
jgi:cytochrome c-type biogenesis protein CcmE